MCEWFIKKIKLKLKKKCCECSDECECQCVLSFCFMLERPVPHTHTTTFVQGRAGSPIFLLMFGALHTSSLQKRNNLPVQDQKCPLMVFHGLSSGFVTEWADDAVLLSLTNTYTCTASLSTSGTEKVCHFIFPLLQLLFFGLSNWDIHSDKLLSATPNT